MPACDICDAPPGPDAKRFTADRLRAAVDSGYRPAAVIEHYRSLAGRLGLDRGDDHWYGEWVAQVRQDRTDWLLCQSCWTGLEAHLKRPDTGQFAGAPPVSPSASPPRRRWFGRWRR
ncbi:hypothetical protein ABN028_02095 [Actinopolymorpha sp. B17G11]|uniref:hypothetical protein n=1 Tax=Actinopolymorpha sp. B17G11 TaxID=3160861 RepID=UPI0032E40248